MPLVCIHFLGCKSWMLIIYIQLSGKETPLEPTIDAHISFWLQLLSHKYTSSESSSPALNLSLHIPFLTLDIITELCLSESFNCIENECDKYGFLAALQTGMIAQGYISSLLEVKDFLFWIGRFGWVKERLFPNVKDKDGIGRVMSVRSCFCCHIFLPPFLELLAIDEIVGSTKSCRKKARIPANARIKDERHARLISVSWHDPRTSSKRTNCNSVSPPETLLFIV